MVNTGKSNSVRQYVIFSYLTFWIMVLGICGTASIVFHASPLTMRCLSNLTAWSPTFVLLVMFKKLLPNMTLKTFYQRAFKGKLKLSLLLAIPFIISGSMIISVYILSLFEHTSFSTYFTTGLFSLPISIILSLTSGPTGEESGWRGYLRYELNNKFSFLKSCFLQGSIWTFWHTVLWFIDSEFLDWRIIPYVLSNLIVMTALVIIMNIVLEKYDNLIYAIWIHFCFNLPYSFLNVDILFYIILSIVFMLVTSIIYKCYKKKA